MSWMDESLTMRRAIMQHDRAIAGHQAGQRVLAAAERWGHHPQCDFTKGLDTCDCLYGAVLELARHYGDNQ